MPSRLHASKNDFSRAGKKGFSSDERAQGAFEYVLLLAGIMLVAVLVIVVLKSAVLPSTNEQLNQSIGNWRQVVKLNCTGVNGSCQGI